MNDIFSKAEKEPRQGIDTLPPLAIFQNLILRGLAYFNLLKIQEMKLTAVRMCHILESVHRVGVPNPVCATFLLSLRKVDRHFGEYLWKMSTLRRAQIIYV